MVINNSVTRPLQTHIARDEYPPRGEHHQQQEQHLDGGECGLPTAASLPPAGVGAPYQSCLWQWNKQQQGTGDVLLEDCSSSSSSHSSGWNSDDEKCAAGPATTPPFPGRMVASNHNQHLLPYKPSPDLLRVWGEGALFVSHNTNPRQVPGCHLLLSEHQALPLPPPLLPATQPLHLREHLVCYPVPFLPQQPKLPNKMDENRYFGYITDCDNESYLVSRTLYWRTPRARSLGYNL
jgi:hypothetical protein